MINNASQSELVDVISGFTVAIEGKQGKTDKTQKQIEVNAQGVSAYLRGQAT